MIYMYTDIGICVYIYIYIYIYTHMIGPPEAAGGGGPGRRPGAGHQPEGPCYILV